VAVRLAAIADANSVNALASGQRLVIPDVGLVSVYGENGAGKSGYVRILKRACRAQGSDFPVLSNAYEAAPTSPATAKIAYHVGTTEQESTWTDGRAFDQVLSNIRIFDTHLANLRVAESNELTFTPLGLQLLASLAEVCRQIRTRLDEEIMPLEEVPTPLRNSGCRIDTAVGKLLATLSAQTQPAACATLASLSPAENSRLNELRAELAQNPAKRALEVRSQITQVQSLVSTIDEIAVALSDGAYVTHLNLVEEAFQRKNAAELAALRAFSADPLQGVGSETWQLLWSAARRYSTEAAYPGKSFPQSDRGARCVLCQQPLGDEGASRLMRLEEFVQADLRQAADLAQSRLAQSTRALKQLQIPFLHQVSAILSSCDDGLRHRVRQYLVHSKLRRRDSLRNLPIAAAQKTPPAGPLVGSIRERSEQLDKKARELDAAALSTAALQQELAELEDREMLARLLPLVEQHISALSQAHTLAAARKDCETRPITSESTRLAASLVTEKVRATFIEELSRLGFRSARVDFERTAGEYGVQKFKIRLQSKADHVLPKVADILSEGEHRCVALAAFFTELSVSGNPSAIVLDDPVSSLDNRWRNSIAKRLVAEATCRQVVVFTHDAVFLMMLSEACEGTTLKEQTVALERRGCEVGLPLKGPPWMAKSVGERIGQLKQVVQQLTADFARIPQSEYEPRARECYCLLRETWERAVEEILLNKCVMRFKRSIETNRLKAIADDIKRNDVDRIVAMMTKASRFVHDEATPICEEVPEPAEIDRDLKELVSWVHSMRKRGRN
jgi:energy-coupling factor transporter ATP-binding protein EcfA2